MLPAGCRGGYFQASFSTLQCGSWIDAAMPRAEAHRQQVVSVPFNAGRGLMPQEPLLIRRQKHSFSTLQCGSWIDAR